MRQTIIVLIFWHLTLTIFLVGLLVGAHEQRAINEHVLHLLTNSTPSPMPPPRFDFRRHEAAWKHLP